MLKVMFMPFRLFAGLLSGLLSRKLFARVWRVIDKEQPPNPDQRQVSVRKLAAALLLQGAVFSAVRGLIDHGSRRAFKRVTGRWPGEKQRKQSDSGQ